MKSRHIVTASILFLTVASANRAYADSFGGDENTFEIEFVTIGDPGNEPDTTGRPDPAGSVAQVYRIGKYEISREMITMANAEGNLEIALHSLPDVSGGPRPQMPATGVSWNEAARFVNWLNASAGHPPAYKFDADPSDASYNANSHIELWEAGDAGFNEDNLFRNSLAHYFLPSLNEWYKAAYYDPQVNDGDGGYWHFGTGSDTPPIAVTSGTSEDTAVFSHPLAQGPAFITEAGGVNSHGVMAMEGNVAEWLETEIDLINDLGPSSRIVRTSNWNSELRLLGASNQSDLGPDFPFANALGFRVASIAQNVVLGDFDENGELDIADINMLVWESAAGINNPDFDLTNDELVDGADVSFWIKDLKTSWIGDANLDGEFSSGDLIATFTAGRYETGENADWSEGDWTGDHRFDSADLVAAFTDGGYELGPRPSVASVPEPSSSAMLIAGVIGIAIRRFCRT